MGADGGARRRRAGAGMLAAALLVGLLAGGLAMGRGGRLGRPAATGAAEVPTGTATVTRTDVVERQQVAGRLGYDGRFVVVGQAPGADEGGQSQGGIVTRLPAAGGVVGRGQALYEVDGRPVPLWYGTRPAWRPFGLGMADGADVRQAEVNLVALGFDPGRAVTVDRHYSWATVAAVRRWQRAAGRPRTGAIRLGEVAFLPGPVRVATVTATVGAAVLAGTELLTASSTRPVVSVALDPAFQQLVRRGDRVLVTLPDGDAIRGRVREVGRVAAVPGTGTGEGQADDRAEDAGQAAVPVTVGLADPRAAADLDQAPVQVAITTEAHRGVLAAPITALLADRGGGYAVELVEGGRQRRVAVRTGLFDDTAGLVELAGPGLAEGATVQVPAP